MNPLMKLWIYLESWSSLKKYIEPLKIILSIILFVLSYVFPKYKLIFLVLSYIIVSYELYINAIKEILEGEIFNENILMIIATIGAFVIKSYSEAVIVVLLFQIGEYLSDLAVDNSKKKIVSLIDLKSDFVNLKKDNEIKKVDIKEVEINDIFVVKPGEKVPLDGIIIDGVSSVDTSSLTGEAVPKTVKKNDFVLSGYINKNSILTVKSTSIYETSTAYKIIDLIENSNDKKGKTEKFITKFSKIYTPIIVVVAFLLVIIPVLIFKQDFNTWLYKSLIFLVTSCPCALVISIPLSYFCGIGKSSHNGILIKGSNILDKLVNVQNIAFDKTGTITEGVFEVTKIESNTLSKEDLLALAAKAESFSNHPIARAIVKSYNKKIDNKDIKNYKEISGSGIRCRINNKSILIGTAKFMKENNIPIEEKEVIGSVSYIAIDKKLEGYIVVSDKIKNNAKKTLASLKEMGIKNLVMLSGDNTKSVKLISESIDMDNYFAELLPIDKVNKVKKLRKEGTTLFIGDGMNDAPVMKCADIGVSMGMVGSDAAIEYSDIVIMNDNLEKLPEMIKISRLVKQKMLTNITFALLVKFIVLLLAVLKTTSIWMAVFADVGVTMISILNSLLIMVKKV